MIGELGRDWSLPLLPAGARIFDDLPIRALVLEALAPAIGNGVIAMRDGDDEGILVVRAALLSETVWVADGVRSTGDRAIALIHEAAFATVSASRLPEDAMSLIGPLIRGIPCYADLHLEWVVWQHLLTDLCARGETFAVELVAPKGRGVTVLQGGRQIATFAESHPTLGDPELLDDLVAGGVGTIRILIDSLEKLPAQAEPHVMAAPIVEAQRRDVVAPLVTLPVVLESDDANATLSALFGPPGDASDQHELIGFDGRGQQGSIQVDSVLPQLKLLVRSRLQRSAGSVEEVVDCAAHDRQSVEWLSDRVRAMAMRGFLHSTFDQLADDMLALAARQSD